MIYDRRPVSETFSMIARLFFPRRAAQDRSIVFRQQGSCSGAVPADRQDRTRRWTDEPYLWALCSLSWMNPTPTLFLLKKIVLRMFICTENFFFENVSFSGYRRGGFPVSAKLPYSHRPAFRSLIVLLVRFFNEQKKINENVYAPVLVYFVRTIPIRIMLSLRT